jgi:hypothetical protein
MQDSINTSTKMENKVQSNDLAFQCTNGVKSGLAIPGALAALTAVSAFLMACKKEQVGLYELNDVPLVSSAADKDKTKSNQQYVSILYTNLFQTALSSSDVFDLDRLFQSIGDKDVAREILISNFFNDPGVQLPTIQEMNADIDLFIENTYKRFFVRTPNEAERTWVKTFIQSNPYMTPELVFFAFALSNEYQYY